MRVFLASDIHGRSERLRDALKREDVDLVVLAGDLSNGSLSEVRDAVRVAKEHGYVLFVPGNMDPPKLLTIEDLEGGVNIHLRRHEYSKWTFGGHGGGNKSPFITPIEFSENDIRRGLAGLGDVDVLVVHAPPYNTRLDMARSGLHVGSKAIRRYIEERKPVLCLCGHIHESPGIDQIGPTKIVNPGPMMRGRYAIVKLQGDISIDLKTL